jgi:hypothetical protein
MDSEYIDPTRSSRIRVIAYLLAVVSCLFGANAGIRAFSMHVVPMPPCDQVPWLRLVLALLGILMLVPALIYGRTAWNVYVHHQFPPPGTPVFFRTKVQRGPLAALQGMSALVISAGLVWLFGYLAGSETVQVIFFGASSCGVVN